MTNFTVITTVHGFQPLSPFSFPAAMAQRNSLLERKTLIFRVDHSGYATQFSAIDFSNWTVHVVEMKPLFSGHFQLNFQWSISQIERCTWSVCNLFSVVFFYRQNDNILSIFKYQMYCTYDCCFTLTMLQWNIEAFFFSWTRQWQNTTKSCFFL